MNRSALVEKFTAFLPEVGSKGWLGKKELATFLTWYFRYALKDEYDTTGIEIYLAKITAEAMLAFKNSRDPGVEYLRTKYLNKVRQYSFPDITDIQEDSYRLLICNRVAHLMAEVTGMKQLAVEIEQYLLAQDNALDHSLQRFNRQVWRTGLWNYLRTKATGKGVIGTFGNAKLGLFVVGQSVTISFVRLEQQLGSKGYGVCFNAAISDSTGINTALSSINVNLGSAMEMIEEVVTAWPSEREAQSQVFRDAMTA